MSTASSGAVVTSGGLSCAAVAQADAAGEGAASALLTLLARVFLGLLHLIDQRVCYPTVLDLFRTKVWTSQ